MTYKVVYLEYNSAIYQCPTEPDGWMCDLEDPCEDCPYFVNSKGERKE